MSHSRKFSKILTILILTFFHSNGSLTSDSSENTLETSLEPEFDVTYPCENAILGMSRPTGPVTRETNYWNARVNLQDFTYLKTIKFVIRVDQLAKLDVDPEVARVTGAKTAKVLRVIFYGSPSNVTEARFRVIGTNGKHFPNLVTLYLNNRNICMGAITVSDIF